MSYRRYIYIVFAVLVILCISSDIWAQNIPVPRLNVEVGEARGPREVAVTLQLLLLLTVLSLAPSIIIMFTSFIRIYTVLSFIPRALTTQNLPPNQVIIALSLFLTLYVMWPTFSKVYEEAVSPYLNGKLTAQQAYEKGIKPIREFMFKQTNEKYIYRFIKMANLPRPKNPDEVPTYVLLPAFMVNELTVGFYIGAVILIPFLIIDVVTASILMSMGMIMLPPVMISFPLKILFFFLIDGWDLVIERLVRSFM